MKYERAQTHHKGIIKCRTDYGKKQGDLFESGNEFLIYYYSQCIGLNFPLLQFKRGLQREHN